MGRVLFAGALMLLSIPLTAGERVILLTGFEPFGGAKINASWEAVKFFQGKTIAGHRVETVQLPVVYDAIEAPLKEAIAKFKPAAVLCFGEGTPAIQIETIARNGYHAAKPPDNKGLPPPREKIVPNGKDEIPTGLPVQEIVQAIRSTQVHSITSEDAGGYLCNECFYRLMALPDAPKTRGFIHLPVITQGRYRLPELQRAVGIAASVSVGVAPLRIANVGYSFWIQATHAEDHWVGQLSMKILGGGHAISDPFTLKDARKSEQDELRLPQNMGPFKFNLIFVHTGFQDHTNGIATRNFSIRETLADIKKLNAKAVVLSIPDFTVTEWGQKNGYNSDISKRKLREFNAKLAEEAAESGALFIDITPLSVEHANDSSMFQSGETFSYSPKMYGLWADHIYKVLVGKKMLTP